MTESLVNDAGGIEGWDRLGSDEQQRCYKIAHQKLLICIRQEHFNSLTQSEKDDINFFVWAGCCMHKELNVLQEHPLLAWPLFIFFLTLTFYLYPKDYVCIHMQYLFWLTILSPYLYWLYSL
jgi:hypothetical protein